MALFFRRAFPRTRIAILAIGCAVAGIVSVVRGVGPAWNEPVAVAGPVVRYEVVTRRGRFFTKSRRLRLVAEGGHAYRYTDEMPRFDEVRAALGRTQGPVTILADDDQVHEIRIAGEPLVRKEEVQAALEKSHRLTIPFAVLLFAVSGFAAWRYRVVDRRLSEGAAEECDAPPPPPPAGDGPANALDPELRELLTDLPADLDALLRHVAADDGSAVARTYQERVAGIEARDHAALEAARRWVRYSDSTVLRYAIRGTEGEAGETIVETAECGGGPAFRFRRGAGEWEPIPPGPNLVAG